ncbi:hypothetical protein MPTK1_1g13610 [Marchantia polymorpha subsp. ruderalis]|uniref:RanBP2-type domain-containing protein n=2 Tax=Marchantia polymorpha TaxID=3197 RepID=A0AAF6APS5_MARPO|nr:hypothetical protein MARPO_0019s0131 [Marchantia polymorpha]BBM98445.1 hypothetical protein Mp_1g13610 [Marchantia polymorpha subsp. ruderalis]|eukprot:PTQ44715.1 hypothetical protein MARPO_0019s0131 [Marchantia polymorpha]
MNRKPGDWNCPSCQHLNFSRRDTCQRCSDARPGGGMGGVGRADGGGDYGSYGSRGGGSYGFGSGYGSGGGGGGDYGRSYGGSFGFGASSDSGVRPGDWYCPASGCGAHNFASRSNCFKCGVFKEESASGGVGLSQGYDGGSRGSRGSFGFGSSYSAGGAGPGAGVGARQGWKSGDWICGRSGCNEHNFASRMECYRCNAPRESGAEGLVLH